VGLRSDAVAGKLPRPSAWPLTRCHRPGAVLGEPKAVRGEIVVDAAAKLLFYEEPGIEHGLAADRVVHPEQKFLGINERDAFILVVERE